MNRVTTANSPFTLLQQRLKYVSLHPERPWHVWVENVPQWELQHPLVEFNNELVSEYAPCGGYDFLLDAICRREEEKYRILTDHEQILITNGALHGLSLIFRTLYRPEAIALCQGPILGSIATILQEYGYTIKYFSSHQGEVDMEMLKSECDNSNVRLIYINTPHNPTGDILSEDALAQLVDISQRKGIKLIADMIYDDITYDGAQTYSPLSVSNNWKNIYTVNSMSKNYGSPGLRIGWVISDRENIKRMAGLLEQECVAVSGNAQKHAYLLLKNGNQKLVETIVKRKKVVEDMLSRFEGITYMVPRGGTQFFVELPIEDVDLFADFMLVNYNLAITTCSNYQGVKGSYIRIPTIYPIPTSQAAFRLLKDGIKQFASLSPRGVESYV
jgi:aspartate aminotransferase